MAGGSLYIALCLYVTSTGGCGGGARNRFWYVPAGFFKADVLEDAQLAAFQLQQIPNLQSFLGPRNASQTAYGLAASCTRPFS